MDGNRAKLGAAGRRGQHVVHGGRNTRLKEPHLCAEAQSNHRTQITPKTRATISLKLLILKGADFVIFKYFFTDL